MRNDDVGVGQGREQICRITRTVAVEKQEDKIRHNGQENVDRVPLIVTTTAVLMAPSPSPAEERPKH